MSKEIISPKKYIQLNQEEKARYYPLYKKYKKEKYSYTETSSCCEDCNECECSVERVIEGYKDMPVGKPYAYEKMSFLVEAWSDQYNFRFGNTSNV